VERLKWLHCVNGVVQVEGAQVTKGRLLLAILLGYLRSTFLHFSSVIP
jgi:hypothetical protein